MALANAHANFTFAAATGATDDTNINRYEPQPSDADKTPGNSDEEAKNSSAGAPFEAAEPQSDEGGAVQPDYDGRKHRPPVEDGESDDAQTGGDPAWGDENRL